MALRLADLPAVEAAADLAFFAAAASAAGWPAASNKSSPGINQVIGFIIVFKAEIKTDVSFFAAGAPVKRSAMFLLIFDVWA